MSRIIRLTENELTRIIKRIVSEQGSIGPVTSMTTQNWDVIPNLETVYKQNPDLTKVGKSIGEELKQGAAGWGDTDEEMLKRAVERLRNYCDMYRKNYASEPDRANYYVAALFAVVDRYVSDYTDYSSVVELLDEELSGSDKKYVAGVIRIASGGKVDISTPYTGIDSLLDLFGF